MGKSKLNIKIDELTVTHKDASAEDIIKVLAESSIALDSANSKIEKSKSALKKSEDNAVALKEELKFSEADVEELNGKLADYESGKIKKFPKPTVKVGNITYEINSPQAKIKGKVFSVQQLRENKEEVILDGKSIQIADFLVKKQSGILSPKI